APRCGPGRGRALPSAHRHRHRPHRARHDHRCAAGGAARGRAAGRAGPGVGAPGHHGGRRRLPEEPDGGGGGLAQPRRGRRRHLGAAGRGPGLHASDRGRGAHHPHRPDDRQPPRQPVPARGAHPRAGRAGGDHRPRLGRHPHLPRARGDGTGRRRRAPRAGRAAGRLHPGGRRQPGVDPRARAERVAALRRPLTLTYNPSSSQLGRQPVPLRYVVLDGEGAPVGSGRVSVTVPIISDLYVSAPYGHDIEFAVGEGQQFVDSETLRLEPPDGEEGMDVDEEGTEVVVPDQGVWTLDRESATVRFSPESDQVRETAPMFVTGGDGEGAEAAPALLSTAYPILVDRHQSAAPGTEAVFDLTTGIRDVRSDSLRFDPEQLPEAAELSEDGTELVVPGEGALTIDLGTRTVTMDPEEYMTGAATPVAITGSGVYADNPVSATLEAVFSPVLATLRD